MTRTALVTGATSGIGRAVARSLVAEGYHVIGTSRDPESIAESARIDGVDYRALDLADPASVEHLGATLPAVDVLVNNAGESQSGPIEELPRDAIERLFQLNVFGPVRLTQLALPGMRQRGFGRVVMVGSMIASFPIPYRSSYAASKAAIKAFADAARFEVAPFGVWITTVEPGSIDTGISQRRTKYIDGDSPYADGFHTVIAALDEKEASGISADEVAATVVAAIAADRPKPLYAKGSRAPLVFLLRRLLPAAVVEQGVAASFGVRAGRV